ncbi:3-deoxy-8-phosphooctulonate synthase [Bacillus sp. Gen3]|uniref:2-dehydro-3-deoxyphosphooctonate aldolase n=1 Tax=Heyndrickxia oleronia TaxID=38875 RepID=A0A8E2LBN1_9BACI|nr:3-deoxy-8-phosphooctulonate synthase [Heyndrickxia oleronia]NYV64904.1 3-deoxy-8-phosphooctulonate synthase [Bacillus sp. Gen3]OOP66115.1 3-deoxy-8-phosphooctulonate synthase [Heyndrickxia oleronia]QQZ07204.1 3-deoxy-8-phosphooctulonate synthase [Heyndrickxia oleronia]
MLTKEIKLNDKIKFGSNSPFVLIAGPCLIESEELIDKTAATLIEITTKLNIPFIFKASFDKANRSSIYSERGPGLEKGLEMLSKLKEKYMIPVTSDIHESHQAKIAGEVLDIIQIPAFLCRQTDLLIAAAKTQKIINVKKGQFLAPNDMENIVIKLKESGNDQVLLTERGTNFGYHNLVVDMRSLPILQELNVPVVFDATHSVQIPGGLGITSGGNREYAPVLARAAMAVGIDALFLEVHPDPVNALSDGPNMVKLDHLEEILKKLKKIDELVKLDVGS